MVEPRRQLAKRTPAVHLKIATKISSGMTSLDDVYYDTTMKSLFGSTVTTTVNGQTPTKDHHATRRLICKIHSEYRYPIHLKIRSRGAPEP